MDKCEETVTHWLQNPLCFFQVTRLNIRFSVQCKTCKTSIPCLRGGRVRLLGNIPNVSQCVPLCLPACSTVTRPLDCNQTGTSLLSSSGFGHFPNPDSIACVSGSAGLWNRKGSQQERFCSISVCWEQKSGLRFLCKGNTCMNRS